MNKILVAGVLSEDELLVETSMAIRISLSPEHEMASVL